MGQGKRFIGMEREKREREAGQDDEAARGQRSAPFLKGVSETGGRGDRLRLLTFLTFASRLCEGRKAGKH